MDTGNTRHSLPNRISKGKRQCRSRRPNQKRKQGHSKRKKNISKRINVRSSQKTGISLPTKYSPVM